MNRESTKSYYCHICAKNFCWTCHQQLNLCQCFTNPKLVGVAQNQKRKKLLKKQKAEIIDSDEQNSSFEKSEGENLEEIDQNEPNEQQESPRNEENPKKPKSPRKNRANSKTKGLLGGLITSAFRKEKQLGKQKLKK